MRIVLTGSSGFLGRNLYNELTINGHEVICLVRNAQGFANEIIADIDLITQEELLSVLKGVDSVIHLAALADFRKNFSPDIYQTNCLSTINLIWAVKKLGVHFVYASNALIAGIENQYIDANTPDNPDIPYNISKYICERLIEKELNSFSILRIGGIFGLFGPEHLYLNKAITAALTKQTPPTIKGTGEVLRNYVYVKDLAKCIRALTEKRTQGKVLICGEDTKSVKELLEMVTHIYIGADKIPEVIESADRGFDQVIKGDIMPVKLRTYEEAFLDIADEFKSSN